LARIVLNIYFIEIFSLYIAMSLRRADVIMTSSKSRFYCIRGEKS